MVEGNGLENRRWATIREFESHLLRQVLKKLLRNQGLFFRLDFLLICLFVEVLLWVSVELQLISFSSISIPASGTGPATATLLFLLNY